jgi:hypothetical protein
MPFDKDGGYHSEYGYTPPPGHRCEGCSPDKIRIETLRQAVESAGRALQVASKALAEGME